MAQQTQQTFTVGEQQGGKSLQELRDVQNLAFRPDVLAGLLGISERNPLTAGQQFNVDVSDIGSGEIKALPKLFGAGMTPEQQSQQIASQKSAEARGLAQQAVQPAMQTLQGQQEPLKQRYDKIIQDIQAQRGLRTQQAEVASSREFGKRGIQLSSGAYDQYLQQQRLPIDVQYGGLLQQAGGEQETKLMQLAQAISGLQAQGGLTGFTEGQEAGQFAQQQGQQASQYAQTLAEQMRSSKVDEELRRLALAPKEESPYMVLGEGQSVFDINKSQQIFKNPKTYKEGGGEGDGY